MTLPELSIHRHVLATMLSAVLVLFGIISYQRLGVDRFPYIEFPVVSVTTALPGANPDIVDTSITGVIETALNTIPGIDHIQSTSSPGISSVAITFNLDKDIDIAFNEVQAKINQVIRRLPQDADPPVVAKVQTGAQPIMWMSLQGDRTLQQLNLYARNTIKKQLETIDGVGEIRIGGERRRVIRVALNTQRMAALGVAANDVVQAFNNQHIQVAGGFLVGKQTERLIKLDLEYHRLSELQQMVLLYRNNAPIRLGDVATIEDGLADFRQLARFNGKPTVGLGIVKVANTNTVAIIDKVLERVENDIRPQLPPGMTLTISSNDAIFIKDMVTSLQEHILLGTLLASLVVWLFLHSMRSTLIIAVAIPVSLLGAVAVMYFSGYTFNALTLLALLLLIGVVVDDAIVVLENIFRHRQKLNTDPMSAALSGTREVVFAVMAATLTLVSIFAPVIFMGGIIGNFFESFAVVVTFGVLVSLFVSLTLTPMLCSRFLEAKEKRGRVYDRLNDLFARMDGLYRRSLARALAHPWKIIIFASVLVATSMVFFVTIEKGFAPEEDESRFLVTFKAPLGSSIDYTDGRLREIEAVVARHKEVASYFAAIGLGQAAQVNQGLAFVRLVPPSERDRSQQEILKVLRGELAQIPGVRAFASAPPLVPGMRGEPLQFIVQGPALSEVARLSEELQTRLTAEPGMGRLDMDLQLNLPELRLEVDRVRAASLGLTARDVATAVNILAGGMDIAKYNDLPGDGERYDVRIKAAGGELAAPQDLTRIYLRTAQGQSVRLDTVARFVPQLGAAVISRYDLQYAANFYGTPQMALGDAVKKLETVAGEILPLGYKIKFQGQAEEMKKTGAAMAGAFALALVLLYMVLASQFNSFVQPFIIMMAQPLAIAGGIFSLWILNTAFGFKWILGDEVGMAAMSLNIFSMIGLLLLMGLVAKNSILLVDLTNQYRAQGKDIRTALLEACPIRMRPVLMTSLTIVLAELPAAIGIGAGSQSNAPLAVAVIGGMVFSTLLTLILVPAVYLLIEERLERWQARRISS